MTIFDSIRYPISDLPTVKELEVLPSDLFNQWVESTEWNHPDRRKTPFLIGTWYALTPALKMADVKEVKLLRKMILEYTIHEQDIVNPL